PDVVDTDSFSVSDQHDGNLYYRAGAEREEILPAQEALRQRAAHRGRTCLLTISFSQYLMNKQPQCSTHSPTVRATDLPGSPGPKYFAKLLLIETKGNGKERKV